MRQGFYFSFDALLALSLLGLTTVLLLGTSAPVQQDADRSVETFRATNNIAEDAVQAASHAALKQAFSQDTVDDYVNDTALDADDTDKSVLDVVALLWASNETRAAANISKRFFDGIVPAGYGYSINISGDTAALIYNSSRPDDPAALANAHRIVSGVEKDRPQEGYLARARATRVDKNTTDVFGMPMAGSAVRGGQSHALDLNRSFHLDAEEIHNATLYLSLRTGGSDPNSIDVRVNGQDAGFPNTWDYEVEKDGNNLLFHKEQVTALLHSGWNSVFVSAKNTGGNNEVDEAVQLNPGSRVSVTYSSNETGNLSSEFSERKYFTNIETEGHNNNDHGVWQVMSYYVPEGADVTNVTVQVTGRDVDEVASTGEGGEGGGEGDGGEGDGGEGQPRQEFKVYLNNEKINGTDFCTSGCNGEKDFQFQINLTNKTKPGTNVVTVYLDTFLDDDGTISGFGDDDRIELFAEPETAPDNSSYLEYSYERARSELVFGKIELTRTDRFGGGRSNPKAYNASFEGNASVLSTFVHLAQLDSENVTLTVEDGERTTPFVSPRDYATPTDLFIGPDAYDRSEGVNNTITVSDDCTDECSILPETTFERQLLITSQVGYGDTFPNLSAAQTDAKERLNETLGEYVDATDIASDALSVNNVPWLFGPATVELEVWRKE